MGPALTLSSPRTKIGSQNRIYAYMKSVSPDGDFLFKQQLILQLGLNFMPVVNPWTGL